jgi:thiazole synthase
MIGSGQGLTHPDALRRMREELPDIPLVVDAGIGKPSDAAFAMELGYDAILINSAVALSDHPPAMAGAFAMAVKAGRQGYESGLMSPRDFASPSTPTLGTPFWQQEASKA